MEDLVASAEYAMSTYPGVPIFMCGYSFGGPSVWAAARRLTSAQGHSLGGVISIAGSARGGARFEELQLDTVGAVRHVTSLGVPALFVTGDQDTNVPLPVSALQWHAAEKQHRTLVVVQDSFHSMDHARDQLYQVLLWWLVSSVQPKAPRRALPEAVCVALKGGSTYPPPYRHIEDPTAPDLATLQEPTFKGYNE